MQTKLLNAYRITHKDGTIENISAENLMQALENTAVSESESPVIQTFMVKEGIATVIEELPADVLFTSIVSENGGGSIATPSQGKVHVGDMLAFKAIPARNYAFVSWTRNGRVISTEASFLYEMEPLLENEDTAVFMANFELAPVSWTTRVEPPEATGAGCVAFPESGTIEANAELGLIAVEEEGYVFDHWERNGENLGTNKILETTAVPLAEGEESAVYVAVFTEE